MVRPPWSVDVLTAKAYHSRPVLAGRHLDDELLVWSDPEARLPVQPLRGTAHERHIGMTVIEVFADVACPFTHVGLRRFVERRTELGRYDVTLRVRAWPLEIVNGRPLDPHFITEEIEDIRQQIAPALFDGFAEASFPESSVPALTLAAAAYDKDLAIGERVSLALRDLLFEHGVDIADTEVLRRLAADHDVRVDLADTRGVLDDHAEGVARGVIGSPHFFTPAGGFFCPALDVHRDASGHLRITADAPGFDRFVAMCFG
jgi:predicted DsbA family dithiol-disulfide isomerase